MTQHDLGTLLREHVHTTEPPGVMDPTVPVRLGRRRLRTRVAVGGAAVVALVATATVTPFVLLDRREPTRTAHGASYDAEAMPQLLDQHVREVLDRDVKSLGPVTFSAHDDRTTDPLPPGRYDEATRMEVDYGRITHRYWVTVLHAGSEAEGPVRKICRVEMTSHLAFSCTVDFVQGMFVVTTVRVVQPMAANPLNDRGYTVVRTDQLDSVPPGRRYFIRTVKVIKSDTLLTYVNEQVRTTTLLRAHHAFRVPVADMVEIGTDPALAIPMPEAAH